MQQPLPGLSGLRPAETGPEWRLVMAAVCCSSHLAPPVLTAAVVRVVTGTRDPGSQQMWNL